MQSLQRISPQLEILDNGITIEDGEFRSLWFQVRSGSRTFYRCVSLAELTSLAVDDQEIDDYNTYGKQWGVIRGMYNAGVHFVYVAAGMFHPRYVGVTQMFGAAADAETRAAAERMARVRLDAVRSALAGNFQQSRSRPPLIEWMEWYLDFVVNRARNVAAILGHPDPRDPRRGQGADASGMVPGLDDLAAEQNEILFRGLAKIQADFVFQIAADRLRRADLTKALIRTDTLASNIASRRRGAISIGAGISIPIAVALSQGYTSAHGRTDSRSRSTADGRTQSLGRGHTESYAHTESESHSSGGSESHSLSVTHSDGESYAASRAHTHSQSVGQTHGSSRSVSLGEAHTKSHSVTDSRGSGTSVGGSFSINHSDTRSHSAGTNWSTGTNAGWSKGASANASASHGWNTGISQSEQSAWAKSEGASYSEGRQASGGMLGVKAGGSKSATHTVSGTESHGSSQGFSYSQSGGTNVGGSTSQGSSFSRSNAHGGSQSNSQGSSDGWSLSGQAGWSNFNSHSVTNGEAHTQSRVVTTGESRSVSRSQGDADTYGVTRGIQSADSVTEGYSWSRSWQHTRGKADTWGKADSVNQGWGRSHTEGSAVGNALSRGGGSIFSGGVSTGIVPSLSLGRSWQTEDWVADQVTQILAGVRAILDQAAAEGGFLTEALLFTESEAALEASKSLVPQAFHGPNSPTPVLTVVPADADADLLRRYGLAFLPYHAPDPADPLKGALGGKYSTVLTAQQVAAYTAPAIFREGTVRILPAIPRKGLGFYPDMPGELVLGHQYSPETADLTTAPVRLDRKRFMHTMFAGATGFGKSVGAMRLVQQAVTKWPDMQGVVLDYGYAWRKLLNAPGLRGSVDVRQLSPYGPRPLRWNPLQISKDIIPEEQAVAFAEIFGQQASLGQRQQQHVFNDIVEAVYNRAGVLVNSPATQADPHWGRVADAAEAALCGAPPGTPLADLDIGQRQPIAIHRSKTVGLSDLYNEVRSRREAARDKVTIQVLDGILRRLKTVMSGLFAKQYAKGEDAIDLGDLVNASGYRLLIIEGGNVPEFIKKWMLAWAGFVIFQNRVALREAQKIDETPSYFIVFEEANKIFAGGVSADPDSPSGAAYVSEQYEAMFRDSRKYGVRFIVITQNPSVIPAGIRDSCTSLVAAYLSNARDKEVVLEAFSKSSKGFTDENWRRFLSDESIGMSIIRLPYVFEREAMRPIVYRPLMVEAREPTNAELAAVLGRIAL